jgi:hypothetical protein
MDVLSPRAGFGSDRPGEFGERSGDPLGGRGVDAESVVSAPEILDERVPAIRRSGGGVGSLGVICRYRLQLRQK